MRTETPARWSGAGKKRRFGGSRLGPLAVLALGVWGGAAQAQALPGTEPSVPPGADSGTLPTTEAPPPSIEQAPPEEIEPGPPAGGPAEGDTLTDELSRSGGVIKPQPGTDPELVQPPPDDGTATTPVIPPPPPTPPGAPDATDGQNGPADPNLQ